MINQEDDKTRCGCDPWDNKQCNNCHTCDPVGDGSCKNHLECYFDPTMLENITNILCTILDRLESCESILCFLRQGIFSPTFGLPEIKSEVSALESFVFGNTFGLVEIISEISAIESAIFSSTYGLQEIKSEVSAIESAVFSDTFGLAEIKSEVSAILATT